MNEELEKEKRKYVRKRAVRRIIMGAAAAVLLVQALLSSGLFYK